MRLRWVGDGTGRLRMRDLWALVNSLVGDETSALFRARNPGYLPPSSQYAIDTINLLALLNVNVRRAAGDKRAKFDPLYDYPGSVWSPAKPAVLLDAQGQLGGYRKGSRAEITEWLRSRGLPHPAPPDPSPASKWLDKLPSGQLTDGQLVDRINRLD